MRREQLRRHEPYIRAIPAALVTLALSLTVAAAIAGATSRGVIDENPLDEICRRATWPMIPAACLEDGGGRNVRQVGADIEAGEAEADAEEQEFNLRFEAAFNG